MLQYTSLHGSPRGRVTADHGIPMLQLFLDDILIHSIVFRYPSSTLE